jgi:hypothetical protein
MCKYSTISTMRDNFCQIYRSWISHKFATIAKQKVREDKLSLSEGNINDDFYHFSSGKNLKTCC